MRNNETKRRLKLIVNILLIVSLILSYLFFRKMQKEYLSISTFKECVDAGYTPSVTYPEECKIPGKTFINSTQIVTTPKEEKITESPEKNMNPKNTSYDIEGKVILLENGISKNNEDTIQYFGNELRKDLDGDSKEDSAFLLTSQGGGTGTFYYLVVALLKNGSYTGTNGILLGDRIAPQTTEFKNGEIVVNYADRKISEPMTTKPSVGISRYFKVVDSTLVEIQK